MDEEIEIINTNTRNERIKNFFINNRKSLISVFVVLILILCGYFLYEELQTRKKAKLAEEVREIEENNKKLQDMKLKEKNKKF